MEVFAILEPLFKQTGTVIDVFRFIWFFILPFILYKTFFPLWMSYIGDVRAENTDFETIEIIPPRNTERSPQPMESVFAGLQGTSTTISVYDELCFGASQPNFSIEIVGTNGRVHFFIDLPSSLRALFESHLYAQYPDVEIRDAHNYIEQVPAIIPNKDWDLWGSDIVLIKPDPIPIKTWERFEETVTGKMIDPLSGLIEMMGRMRKAEHLWFQIIIEPILEGWAKEEGEKFVNELKGKAPVPEKGIIGKIMMAITGFLKRDTDGGEKKDEAPLEFRLSPGERKTLEAVEDNIGRYMFRTKMRMVYIGRREVFRKSMVSGFFGALKQFADFNLNAFKPTLLTDAKYIFRKTRLRFRQRKVFDAYKKRKLNTPRFVLSDRELATVFHMPDMTVVAPSVVRSNITKATAPPDLPIAQ